VHRQRLRAVIVAIAQHLLHHQPIEPLRTPHVRRRVTIAEQRRSGECGESGRLQCRDEANAVARLAALQSVPKPTHHCKAVAR
jgi:hypothetical protein